MLVDSELRELIKNGVLANADAMRIGPVSYDLRNMLFYKDGEAMDVVALQPGDSVFVGAEESIILPNNLTAQVVLKNSRIRQGLAIAAPIYFPGHHTRVFFRVSNISGNEIWLDKGHDIAQLIFDRLAVVPDVPYEGAYTDEFEYRGVGSYSDVYGSETRKIQREAEKVENMEQRIYGNVVAIMGVFVAVFSLINVDLSWAKAQASISSLIILNLSIIGGMSAFAGLLSTILGSRGIKAAPWVIAAVSFLAAIALLFCVH